MTTTTEAAKSTPTKPNPLHDEDLSELTKKEILFWSRKLLLTPSELFTLPKDELEQHLEAVLKEEQDEDLRKERYVRWKRLTEMKRRLLEEQKMRRLKGGNSPRQRNIWDILCQAANEIESMYVSGNSSGGGSYVDEWGNAAPNNPMLCSTMHNAIPENSCFTPPNFPSSFSATPVSMERYATGGTIPYGTPVGGAGNRTFNAARSPARNATFNLPCPPAITNRGNGTFNMSPNRGNATFNMSPNRGNATFNMAPNAGNATFVRPSPAGRGNATFNRSPPRPQSPANRAMVPFCPNPAMTSTPNRCPRTGRAPHFRNYTDYCMSYSGFALTENSQSISIEDDETTSIVRAASRTYSIPNRSRSAPNNRTFAVSPRGKVAAACPRRACPPRQSRSRTMNRTYDASSKCSCCKCSQAAGAPNATFNISRHRSMSPRANC